MGEVKVKNERAALTDSEIVQNGTVVSDLRTEDQVIKEKCKCPDHQSIDNIVKNGHQESSTKVLQKDSCKCDVDFCETFTSSLRLNNHKKGEKTDLIRTRLNLLNEKIVENDKENVKVTAAKVLHTKTPPAPSAQRVNGVKTNSKCKVRVPPRVPVFDSMLPPANPRTVPETHEPKRPVPPTVTNRDQKRPSPLTVTNSDPKPVANRMPTSNAGVKNAAASDLQNSHNTGLRDINTLLNYIEGNKTVDKDALAKKKAAKKEKQRIKKVEEKERIENERRLQEEQILREARRKEEERRKAEALAKQLLDKQNRNKKGQNDGNKQDSKKKKKKGKSNENNKNQESKSNLIEETIPAMVTIKRVTEGDDSPATVTITLKGSTPESDQLLFSLVNGHNNRNKESTTTTVNADKGNKSKNNNSQASTNKSDKEKKKNKKNKKEEVQVKNEEVKLTISVDKNNLTKKESKKKQNKGNDNTNSIKAAKNTKEQKVSNQEFDLPMLHLPPGITITKIEGPHTKPKKSSQSFTQSAQNNANSNLPGSKSGVIVIETEKLMQQSITATAGNNKKNKRKKKKRDAEIKQAQLEAKAQNSTVFTVKNPPFHTLQTNVSNKSPRNTETAIHSNSQQASIFKTENGMVTIRSPNLPPMSNFLSDLKPMLGPEVLTPFPVCHTSLSDTKKNSSFNAKDILSDLPDIEITKVDKVESHRFDKLQGCQPAEISIIPTNNVNNRGDKFQFNKEDWTYESVFTPLKEGEDMISDDRELEAFKRFYQQSMPPELKEKVAHLNVKDIVLKKKSDVTYL